MQSQWTKPSAFSIRFLIAILKFMFSRKAIKDYEIFTVDLAFTNSKCQIDGEDFLRKYEL